MSQPSSSSHTMDTHSHFCIDSTRQCGQKSAFYSSKNKITKIWMEFSFIIFRHQNRHRGKFKAELIVPTYYRLIMRPYLNVIPSILMESPELRVLLRSASSRLFTSQPPPFIADGVISLHRPFVTKNTWGIISRTAFWTISLRFDSTLLLAAGYTQLTRTRVLRTIGKKEKKRKTHF